MDRSIEWFGGLTGFVFKYVCVWKVVEGTKGPRAFIPRELMESYRDESRIRGPNEDSQGCISTMLD